jgi:hypothetical protein
MWAGVSTTASTATQTGTTATYNILALDDPNKRVAALLVARPHIQHSVRLVRHLPPQRHAAQATL